VTTRFFFSDPELAALGAFILALLPAEEGSPSAADLGVAEFLDEFVSASPAGEGALWRAGLEALDEQARSTCGRSFADLDQAELESLLAGLLAADAPPTELAAFARRVKAAAIKAYYRTEHGLHGELKVARPGRSAASTGPAAAFPEPDRSRTHYDVVIVGSGATGGWAAKELTEAGYEVLVLDAGGMPPPGGQSRQPYQVRFRNMFDNLALNGTRQPVQARSWACDEYRAGLFIDDSDHPYEGSEGFTWIRGSSVGGRMNVWGRQVYRYSEQDFAAYNMEGLAEPWPLAYSELAPFYDEVEAFIGVSGACDCVENLPDGKFLPPMSMTDGELHLKQAVESRWPDRRVIIGRTATLTQDHGGRKACDGSGHCYRGCGTRSFFEPLGTTLARARATGRLSLMPNAHVLSLVMDEERGEARGVTYLDLRDGKERTVEARAVVLAASTLASTRILMSTRTESRPDGLGASSGVLGSYLHGHIHSVMCSGRVPWLLKPVGAHDEGRPNQIYIPQFLNNVGQAPEPDFVGGFGIEGAVKHYMFPRDLASRPGFGVELKRSIRDDLVPGHFFLTAFGVMLPRAENGVALSGLKDKWGVPTLKVSCSYGDNDLAMAKAMAESVVEVAEAADFTVDSVSPVPGSPGLCVHEVGTARMGASPNGSVLDPFMRVWDAPNVLVVDGAAFPSSGPQNPTLTMMALSLRASRRLARDLRSGRTAAAWRLAA
jgi:choline dehydrogenase-like flavoprotein